MMEENKITENNSNTEVTLLKSDELPKLSDTKNSNKKENSPTLAQIVFKDKQLILERPENMSFDEYRILRRHQCEVIKKVTSKRIIK